MLRPSLAQAAHCIQCGGYCATGTLFNGLCSECDTKERTPVLPPDLPIVVETHDGGRATLFKVAVSPIDGSLIPIYLTDRWTDGQAWARHRDQVMDTPVHRLPGQLEYPTREEVILEEERTMRGHYEVSIANK